MTLPIAPPFPPVEANQVAKLPAGEEWAYEPKWDGFRCVAFRDGDHIELQSKACKPLARYFPDGVEYVRALAADGFVFDGELVIPQDDTLSFDHLLMRIHPAESRVKKLAAADPCLLIVFDLLVEDGESLLEEPLAERRAALEAFAAKHFHDDGPIRLSPQTTDFAQAESWLMGRHGGLDGVMAKRLDEPYRSGERAMLKIKRLRTADCVVGGFRYSRAGPGVGSLLLGLYDDDGILHHVGFTSAIPRDHRVPLAKELEKIVAPPGFTGRAPGGPSRWNQGQDMEWVPLEPRRVAEVRYDHFSGGRFRHGTAFLRWRPDKDPSQCLLSQVERESRSSLSLLEHEGG